MKKGKEEVEYKNKAGTAWSHSYLNQKPWHPLSYPNQRRKWIAEQTHAERQRKAEEVSREFSQEQDFFRQTAMLTKKEKEKAEAIQALSFMYMRPPGYNAESARAAEIADQRRKLGIIDDELQDEMTQQAEPQRIEEYAQPERKKPRVKDIYGRPLPTEEEFPELKNAPRLDTGAPARVKPFGVEIRNVKCARCGKFGHQSGDRDCSMRDVIMPNEEARLRRDDPLTAIVAQTEMSGKWELKQQPGGMSPPRGGFKADDPNQQILADDIYDEYGGFLGGDGLSSVIASLSRSEKDKKKKKKKTKKKKKKRRKEREEEDENDSSSSSSSSSSDSSDEEDRKHRHHRKHHHRHHHHHPRHHR